MTSALLTYQTQFEWLLPKSALNNLSFKINKLDNQEKTLPGILFITSFPPRECGIATYTQDLVTALSNQFEDSFTCFICALESETEQHNYKQQPKYILNTDCRNSFAKTAFYINRDENIKLVVMQHEFGFFAKKEMEFKQLFDSISKPIVFVFHTVLPNPAADLKLKVEDMAAIASAVIVMTNDAATILNRDYNIPHYKISIIPHGTHLVPPLERIKLKQQYKLFDRKVLTTFGLLSISKNIESTLNALPTVVKKHPDILFLAIGKTHPTILKQEGEKYRNLLERKVQELKLSHYVRFINEYLPLPILLEYLQLSDIYLFTSKDPNQAVSGTFSYAVSCGCPVISTPIPQAKEVLKNNNGLIIGFENPPQLAKAIITLLDDEKLRIQISHNSIHKMASTAWQNSSILHTILFKKIVGNVIQINYTIPAINLIHIKKMTTKFGIIQFARIANPDIFSGYTLDDNARALIAICKHYELVSDNNDLKLINTYLEFIKYCIQPSGNLLNYLSHNKVFTKQNETVNLEDSTGRAIWALGFVSSLKKILPINLTNEAQNLLERLMPHLKNIHSTRAMAFIIKGLHYYNKIECENLIVTFANRLLQMYKHESTSEWFWFEDYLTYGNSLLPEAMLCAYINTNNNEFKRVAKESLGFLISKIFLDNRIKVISNKGWHRKNILNETPIGGEQPIDVAYTIIALEKFYDVFNKDEYKQKAIIAFNWFLGNNHLHQIVYNPCTGGCYDGIEEFNVNLNQGAESTVSYLMARLAMENILYKARTSSALMSNSPLSNLITKPQVYENINI